MIAILVLYEDSRAASGRFGPHEFLLGCVADDLGRPVHELRKLTRDIPLKGVPNVLAVLRDADRLSKVAPGGVPILAVIDSDRIGDHHDYKGWSSADIEEGIRAGFSQPDRLTVVLLERNLESVLAAIRDCDEPPTISADLLADALAKDLDARDRVLGTVGNDASRRNIRDCVRERMPSLTKAIETVRKAVAS